MPADKITSLPHVASGRETTQNQYTLDAQRSPLLALPLELRQNIYEMIIRSYGKGRTQDSQGLFISSGHGISEDHYEVSDRAWMRMLQVNRQIQIEFLRYLIESKQYKICVTETDFHPFLQYLGRIDLGEIDQLRFAIYGNNLCDHKPNRFNALPLSVWNHIMQPTESITYEKYTSYYADPREYRLWALGETDPRDGLPMNLSGLSRVDKIIIDMSYCYLALPPRSIPYMLHNSEQHPAVKFLKNLRSQHSQLQVDILVPELREKDVRVSFLKAFAAMIAGQ